MTDTTDEPYTPLAQIKICSNLSDDGQSCNECPLMTVLPSSFFFMGAAKNEQFSLLSEQPRHEVWLTKPFAVGKFEVTFDEWAACVIDGGCGGKTPFDEGWGRDDRPVINVSWADAQLYVAWLRRKTKLGYRLMSQAEWEYAVRAGTTGPYPWSPDEDAQFANYFGKMGADIWKQTAPVASLQPNKFGLHNLNGNVWEWVQDCWHETYDGAPSDGTPWEYPNCSQHVVRGGAWSYIPGKMRSSARYRSPFNYRSDNLGFRVALSIEPLTASD